MREDLGIFFFLEHLVPQSVEGLNMFQIIYLDQLCIKQMFIVSIYFHLSFICYKFYLLFVNKLFSKTTRFPPFFTITAGRLYQVKKILQTGGLERICFPDFPTFLSLYLCSCFLAYSQQDSCQQSFYFFVTIFWKALRLS